MKPRHEGIIKGEKRAKTGHWGCICSGRKGGRGAADGAVTGRGTREAWHGNHRKRGSEKGDTPEEVG